MMPPTISSTPQGVQRTSIGSPPSNEKLVLTLSCRTYTHSYLCLRQQSSLWATYCDYSLHV